MKCLPEDNRYIVVTFLNALKICPRSFFDILGKAYVLYVELAAALVEMLLQLVYYY